MKSGNSVQINRPKLIKRKKHQSLYCLFNNLNDDKKRINIIPLPQLFNTKISKEKIFVNQKMKDKNIKRQKKPLLNLKKSSFNKYKSLSYKILPIRYSSIKLPKIKNVSESIELKDSKLDLIINKFDEYDDKFKRRPKFLFDAGGMKYMHYKLNKSHDIKLGNENVKSKFNYKKIYPKLFKRIKKIKEL